MNVFKVITSLLIPLLFLTQKLKMCLIVRWSLFSKLSRYSYFYWCSHNYFLQLLVDKVKSKK